MNPKCRCQQNQGAIQKKPERISVSLNNKNVEIDFGTVPFLSKKVKEITIDLEEDQQVEEFEIKSSSKKLYNCNAFYVTPNYSKVNKDAKMIKLKCGYRPLIPFLNSINVFEFTSPTFNLTITTRGESLGPTVTVTNRYLYFFQTPKNPKSKQLFELKNTSNIPAEFFIDIDTKQKLFTVTPLKGVITKEVYIKIVFTPKKFGVYSQQINCIIFGNEPILLYLYGIYDEQIHNRENTSFIYYPFAFEETVNYVAYFREHIEETTKKKNCVLVTLNTNYIDLGTVVREDEGNSLDNSTFNCASMKFETPMVLFKQKVAFSSKNFSVFNNLKHPITVHWIEEDKVFWIYPKEVEIPAFEKFFFKCVFSPLENESVYCRTFTAQVYWKCDYAENSPYEKTVIVPLTLSITLQGNSFPKSQKPLINIEIKPQQLNFPPSLVNTIVYENFVLLNRVTRSIMFKLVPPIKSQITMRPMMGMIDSFIIISARFKTFKVSKRLEEEWKLVVDGQEEKAIPIFVRGLADLPSIEIGNENDLILPTAQVDTVVTERFMLKNTSIFNLHFKFELPEHKLVSITPASGDVRLQDVVPIDVIYQAKVCTPNKMDLICKLHVKKKLNTIVGPDFDHKFTIQCDSAYSELCATPIAEEFHVVEYGTVIKTNFNVFNFGLSAVSFVLNDTEGYNSLDNITLIPNSGYIGPGQHMKIDLELECKTMGENDIQISYYPKNTTEPEADTKITQLLRISYMTVLGRLKIIEIVEHNFGPLFAKTHFWEYLQIERLNEQFIEVQPNQVDSVDIYMPECLLGSKHYVTLLVENISLFDTEIILKRKKMCECEIKQQPVSLNTTKLVYNCPHREILVLESTSDRIDKKSTQMITFKVTYSIPEETILAYEIHLRHHRIFILYVHVYGILPDTGRVSAYNPSFSMKLKPVYLATHAPPIQIFWLYNNTEVPAEVELNQLKISEYCNNENYEVIKCSNTRGELKPFSIFALNFQFCPIQYKIYHIEIPIVLNGEEKILNLEGLGAIKNTIHEEYFYFSMPQSSGETDKFPVVFSSDYIIFEGLPIWNCTEKIIFIKNITKTKVMHYEWSCVDIPKTVKISVLEESGYLLPEQSHAVTIQVKSYYVSVIADFILTCQLTDLQQLYAAKQIEAFEKQLVKEKENAMEFQPKKHRKRKIVQTSGNFNESKQIVSEKDSVIFPMSITARVNIIHRKDVTNFIKLSHIFKYSPPETLEINFSSETESLPELSKSTEMHDITEFVLRRVISDVVFGESFKEIIRAMKEETHIYYSQFSSGEQEPLYLNSKERLQTFFSRPSTPVLAETLKKFICDSVLETFQLSTALKDGGGESKKDFTEKNKCDEEQDAATGSNDVIVNKKDAAISRIIEKLAGMCKEDCTCSEK